MNNIYSFFCIQFDFASQSNTNEWKTNVIPLQLQLDCEYILTNIEQKLESTLA